MNYLIALALAVVSVLLFILVSTRFWQMRTRAKHDIIFKCLAYLLLVCGVFIVVITGNRDLDKYFNKEKVEQCNRAQTLFPDKEFILTDACYVSMGSDLYMKHNSTDTKLYIKQEVMNNGN